MNYEPSSLGPDIARESPERGYRTFPNPEAGEQLRLRPESFADHYTQARMFFRSQTEPEANHIVSALVFELGKCELPRVRGAVLSRLINIDETLATRVAAGLGYRDKIVAAEAPVPAGEMRRSKMLSIIAKAVPTLAGRKVGCLVSDGVDDRLVAELKAAVEKAGAKFKLIAPAVGGVITAREELLPADFRVDGGPSVLFDAVVIIPSAEGGAKLALQAEAVNFLRDAYAHLKVIAYLPTAAPLLVKAGLSHANPDTDRGLIPLSSSSPAEFVKAAAAGRVWEREPMIHAIP